MTVAALLALALVAMAIPAGASTATLMSEKLVAGKPTIGSYGNLAYTKGSVVYTKVVDEENDLVDLYRYSTAASTAKRLMKADGISLGRPRISGLKVVYSRQPSASSNEDDIYVRDLSASSTGVQSRITSDTADQTNPDIAGNIVVWEDDRNGSSDIYAYDLTTKLESIVCTATGNQIDPSVSGSRVVYADNRANSTDWDIYVKDLKTGEEKLLVGSAGNQTNAVISGNNVVYETWTGASSSIRHIKLGTDASGKITASSSRGLSIGTANQYAPDVSGDRVVWVYQGATSSALYYYDLAVGTRHKLFSGTSLIDSPQISSSKVVYIKTDSKGVSRIYLASLKLPKLTIAAPTAVTSGSRVKLTGKLKTSAGSAIAKRSVKIESSTDNKTWTPVWTVKTNSSGAYTYKTAAIKQATYFRATYKGGSTYLSARSAAKKVGLK
ncbi:MAG TPA: hypothetical protein VFG89_08955 [Coriobacteriia bacterium]|nr:hypothetical protein [Coriobacteriia bacterium]